MNEKLISIKDKFNSSSYENEIYYSNGGVYHTMRCDAAYEQFSSDILAR